MDALDTFGRTCLAVGPAAVLLAGSLLTALVAGASPAARRLTLVLGPPASLAVAIAGVYLVVYVIRPAEGSGFLLGAATLALYGLALPFYYLMLGWMGARRARGAARRSPRR